jgi:choline-sulfatase
MLVACSPAPPVVAPVPTASSTVSSPPVPVPVPVPVPDSSSTAPAPPPPVPSKRNVLLITVDSLRPWDGYPRDIAPNLTAFAKDAVVYSRAYSISSYTAMSVGGLLAGRYPSELERSGWFFSAYPDEVTFFPELLQKAGVRTIAGHAHWYFDSKSGFRQGFDAYRLVDGLVEDKKKAVEVTSPQHLELAVAMLSDPANTSGQFFAWFHFMDPHDVYIEHDGIDFGKRARDRYDGEVLYTDRHIAQLLQFVRDQPWGDRTAIIVSADHGEAFGEHKMSRHGFELWNVLTHVPLMIKVPGATPQRIDVPRSAVDLAPTIFELLALPPEAGFEGVSLVPEIIGAAPPEPRDVIIDLPKTSDNFRRRALVWDRWKILALDDDFRFELYDLIDDPGETRDLHAKKPDVFKMMKQRYQAASQRIHEVCPKMRDKLKGKRPEKPC